MYNNKGYLYVCINILRYVIIVNLIITFLYASIAIPHVKLNKT